MYRIVFSRSAEKDLDKIPSAVVKKIGKSIDTLATEPRPQGCKKLQASTENFWRIRVGDYRIIYQIEVEIKIIDIRRIRHRKDVYK